MTSNVTALSGDTLARDADQQDSDRRAGLDPAGIERAAMSVARSLGLRMDNTSERDRAFGIAVQAIAGYVGAASQ